jgi:O-glycosyl hydrolase
MLRALTIAASSASAAAFSTTISVDASASWGAWQGFGVSLAWAGNVFGGRGDLADALFTTLDRVDLGSGVVVPALGLQLARYNVGGSSRADDPPVQVPGHGLVTMDASPNMPRWKAIEAFWLFPNSTDPKSSAWDWTRDADQRAALAAALARNASAQVFSNSPVWFLLSNLNPSGSANGGDDNIPSSSYANHALYMATVAAEFKSRFGVEFEAVEAFNEPTGNWWKSTGTQEGCHIGPPAQAAILPQLRAALDARGLSGTPVASSDESLIDQAVATWNALPAAARAAFDILQVHGYEGAGGARAELYQLAVAQGGKVMRNSEHGEGDFSGASLAAQVALDFNALHVRSWCYWQALDITGWGLLTADMEEAKISAASTKWFVLAGLARHIRTGMDVLNTTSAAAVAAYDAAASRVVVWATNADAHNDQPVVVDLSSFAPSCRGLRVARFATDFSGSGDLYRRYDDTTMSGASFSATLRRASAQTFVVENCSRS